MSYRKEESCRDGKFFAIGITELERRASDQRQGNDEADRDKATYKSGDSDIG